MGFPTVLDIEKVCRVCLRNELELFLIFDEKHKDEDSSTNLADILSECTRYKVNRYDDLPHLICATCMSNARSAYRFKRECEKSYRTLIDILNGKNLDKSAKMELDNEKSTQTDDSALYPCERCEQKYFNFDALRVHREQDHKGSAIVCRFCARTFNRIGYLKTHIAVFHPQSGYTSHNQCRICERQFTRREHMRRHMAVIHKIIENVEVADTVQGEDEPENVSSELEQVLLAETPINTDANALVKPMQSPNLVFETESADGILKQSNCESVAEMADYTNSSIDKCAKEDDDDDEKPLANFVNTTLTSNFIEVLINDKSCANDDALENANVTKDDPDYTTRKERLNARKQRKQAALVARKRKRGRPKDTKRNDKQHRCEICQKNFTTKNYLQRHMEMHEKKRYVCKECTQQYETKEELNAHIKTEGHDKPLLCPECGLRCKTVHLLTVHMRRHNGEKPFKCRFCSKAFPRKDCVKVHEKYHIGEKSHFCETCGKGFTRKYNLIIHLRVHTGERPYKCQHCPQAFAQGNDLKAHIRRHTGERFRCEICEAAFLQGYQIRQHKLQEHGIKEDPPTQRVAKFTSPEEQELQIKQNLQRELAKTLVEPKSTDLHYEEANNAVDTALSERPLDATHDYAYENI